MFDGIPPPPVWIDESTHTEDAVNEQKDNDTDVETEKPLGYHDALAELHIGEKPGLDQGSWWSEKDSLTTDV